MKREESDAEVGDTVEYHPTGSTGTVSYGQVTYIMTHKEEFEPRHITPKASAEDPRYVIKNVHTGKENPYKKDAIIKVVKKAEQKTQ